MYFSTKRNPLLEPNLKIKILVQDQGGGILEYSEDLKLDSNADIEPKEIGSNQLANYLLSTIILPPERLKRRPH
jgi:hypothetical protein